MSINGSSSWNLNVGASSLQGAEGRGRHGGGPLAAASKALGMSSTDITSALQSGKSLDDLAEQQGVSHDDLVAAIKSDMPQNLQNSDRADEIAEKIATTKGPDALRPPPPPGPPPGNSSSSSSSSTSSDGTGVFGSTLTSSQSQTLNALASLLGTDSSSLLDKLSSGTSLADLVKDADVDSGSLASVLQNGLLIDQKM